MRKITVFCGSNAADNYAYQHAADQMAQVLAENEIGLVYNGNTTGLLRRLADGVLRRGGEVTGVIPEKMVSKERVHKRISVMHIVENMQAQKALMAELSDGFIVLPGATETIEEILEVFHTQCGFHNKPCGLLNISGYYDKLLSILQTVDSGEFSEKGYKNLLIIEKDPVLLVRQMQFSQVEYMNK